MARREKRDRSPKTDTNASPRVLKGAFMKGILSTYMEVAGHWYGSSGKFRLVAVFHIIASYLSIIER
jgi:hypothetical protein